MHRIVGETTPIIVFYAIAELLVGGMLGSMINEIRILPGLLILIPPMLNMRGNVSSSFGARLSSGLHLGYIKPDKMTGDLKANIYSNLILTLFLSALLSVFAWITTILAGIPHITLLHFFLISVIAGMLSGIILSFITVGIAVISYRKGLDPDNVTTPSIASMGDIVMILCLLFTVRLVLGIM